MLRGKLIAMLILSLTAVGRAADRLIVHEWGTLTCLQDEGGTALGRINTDDEPVPAFVHQMGNATLFPPTSVFTSDAKGVPAGDPNVTMRLETPVMYFHVPRSQKGPVTVGVDVAFRGGWLTQYFPDAQARTDGVGRADAMPPLTSKSVGRLSWDGLTLNSNKGELPRTDDRVWTAPRAVDSSPISTETEREQFLFYRGVGHVDAPLRVVRNEKEKTLEVHAATEGLAIGQIWLVDTRADGSLAFCAVPKVMPKGTTAVPAEFTSNDYRRENLGVLCSAMRGALVADGLFADEADALLNTWERSYFKNPGERLFFMVPQQWTDAVLPLTFSVPADVTRVMVGRIELVTPAQRALLQRMSRTSLANLKDLKEVTSAMTKLRNDPTRTVAYNALAGGHGDLADLGVKVPPVYADFLELGRFRSALVLNSKDESGTLWALGNVLAP